MFVSSDSAAVNDDAHRLSHVISLMTDVEHALALSLYSLHLSLLMRTVAFSHSDTWGRSYFISVMTDATQCTLSFFTFPMALKIPFMYGFTHKHTLRDAQNTHGTEKRRLTSLLVFVFHGHEHSQ